MAKKKRQSKMSRILLKTSCLAIIGYFIFCVVNYSYKICSLNEKEKQLSNELKQKQKEEQTLSNETKRLEDPEYLAKYAREAYSLSKGDEIIIQKYKEDNIEEKEEKETFSEIDKKIIVICVTIFIIIIIYIIIKTKKHKKEEKVTYKHQAKKKKK